MNNLLFVVLVMTAICMHAVNAQTNPQCDTGTGISEAECEQYVKEGAIYVTFNGRSEMSDTDLFKEVMASVSDEYVILTVLPEHVIIVQQGHHSITNDFTIYFFILNPSGSTFMPVALRKQELYLMVKLNNDQVDELMGMSVTAQEPASGYPLAIPIWAIAILGYVGLVVVIYCIMVLTSDWRRRKMQEFEESLTKQYQVDANGMALNTRAIVASDNDYDEVQTKTYTTMDIGLQTPRDVAIQVYQDEITEATGTAAATTISTEAVIENGYVSINELPPPPPDEDPSYDYVSTQPADEPTDTADIIPMLSADIDEVDAGAAREADDAAVNEGFEADGTDPHDDDPPVVSTQL